MFEVLTRGHHRLIAYTDGTHVALHAATVLRIAWHTNPELTFPTAGGE